MRLYTFDPMTDSRWNNLVASHPNASIFHRREWLQTLVDTYGYRPLVLTSATPGKQLTDGIVFCEVKSWITGRRLVSLPFSDHADPLLEDTACTADFADCLTTIIEKDHLRYVELRPLAWRGSLKAFGAGEQFWVHTLDLTKSEEEIFRNLNKNNLQRRIRRAEREHLEYERGSSEKLLEEFCNLLLITRRRHQLLPQPKSWFRNLAMNLKSDFLIRVARKDGRAIASIITLCHRRTTVYKYGCSDEHYHHLAGMPFLFWKAISESRAEGSVKLDFGRTEPENKGLLRFKDEFGTDRAEITYLQYPPKASDAASITSRVSYVRQVFSVLPGAISWRLGGMLYRHMG